MQSTSALALSKFNRAEEQSYGYRYFDKPGQTIGQEGDDEDEEEDEFDLVSCAKDCCDNDCQCDDCTRCAGNGIRTDDDDYWDSPAAA